MGQVQDKVALVTGAASGIGAAAAELLAREGARVVLTDIDDGGGEAVVGRIRAEGGEAIYLHLDVTEEPRWPEVIGEIERRYGGLHVMVCNAGIGSLYPSVTDMSYEAWRRQMAINVDGVFLNVKYGLPLMRRTEGAGSIIIMSSVAGLRGTPGTACYSASKGAVRMFAKSVALECALERTGIRVNSMHPGIVDTPIWGKVASGPDSTRTSPVDPHAMAMAGSPVGIPIDVKDIAGGVLWLASDASRFMTGAEFVIDGGITAGTAGRRYGSRARAK